jgi:beta-glucosidase
MVQAIKSVRPELRVGLTVASQSLEPASDAPEDIHATANARWYREDQFLSILKDHPMCGDAVGVQAYTHLRIASAKALTGMKRPEASYRVLDPQEHDRKVGMGYGFAPQALAACLRHTHMMTDMPLVATELGIGTEDDAERVEFYQAALAGLAEVVLEGVPVLGGFAWSDLDNWEWEGGFQYRFGLNYVNYETQVRDPRYSAFLFGQIASDQTLVVPNPVYFSQWGPGHGAEIVSTAPEHPILLPNAWSLQEQREAS